MSPNDLPEHERDQLRAERRNAVTASLILRILAVGIVVGALAMWAWFWLPAIVAACVFLTSCFVLGVAPDPDA